MVGQGEVKGGTFSWAARPVHHLRPPVPHCLQALIDPLTQAASVADWADSLLPQLRSGITAARIAAEAAAAEVKRQRAEARQAAPDQAEAVRRKQMRHVLFTQPEVVQVRGGAQGGRVGAGGVWGDKGSEERYAYCLAAACYAGAAACMLPQAGQEVSVYYNPNNTVLHGGQRMFIRGGWNRWRHPRGFGPLEMTPPAEPGAEHFMVGGWAGGVCVEGERSGWGRGRVQLLVNCVDACLPLS